jgi:hypothetical protein
VSGSQNCQPGGAGGHCGSGAHPGAGRHPAGGSGQPGGVLKRHPDATGGPVRSVSIPAPVLSVNPEDREEIPSVARQLPTDRMPPRQRGPRAKRKCRVEEWVVKTARVPIRRTYRVRKPPARPCGQRSGFSPTPPGPRAREWMRVRLATYAVTVDCFCVVTRRAIIRRPQRARPHEASWDLPAQPAPSQPPLAPRPTIPNYPETGRLRNLGSMKDAACLGRHHRADTLRSERGFPGSPGLPNRGGEDSTSKVGHAQIVLPAQRIWEVAARFGPLTNPTA